MRFRVVLLLTVGLLAALGGCSKGWVRYDRLASVSLEPDQAVTIILDRPPANDSAREQEHKLANCVREGLGGRRWAGRIVPADEFRRVALKNLSLDSVPPIDTAWASFTGDPTFKEWIAGSGLRYLISVSGQDTKGPTRGVGEANPFVVFGSAWQVSSLMKAIIVDIVNARHVGTVEARAEGESSVGVLFLGLLPIPIGNASFPEGIACRKLGDGVAEILLANP